MFKERERESAQQIMENNSANLECIGTSYQVYFDNAFDCNLRDLEAVSGNLCRAIQTQCVCLVEVVRNSTRSGARAIELEKIIRSQADC